MTVRTNKKKEIHIKVKYLWTFYFRHVFILTKFSENKINLKISRFNSFVYTYQTKNCYNCFIFQFLEILLGKKGILFSVIDNQTASEDVLRGATQTLENLCIRYWFIYLLSDIHLSMEWTVKKFALLISIMLKKLLENSRSNVWVIWAHSLSLWMCLFIG